MASNSPADEIFAQYGAPTTDSAPASPAMTPADEVFAQYAPKPSNNTKPQSKNSTYQDLVKSTLQSNHYTTIPTTQQQIANQKNDQTATGAGFVRGLNDVVHSLDPAAQWLQDHFGAFGGDKVSSQSLSDLVTGNKKSKAPWYTFGGMLPTAEQAHQYNVTNRQNFDAQYGNNTQATVGRVGGQIVATLPFMGATGGILKAGGNALLDAAPEAIQPALQGVGNFFSGSAGAGRTGAGNVLLRYLSGGVNGAVIGGTAGALTSGQSDAPISDQVGMGAAFGGTLSSGGRVLGGAADAIFHKISGSNIGQYTANLAHKAINDYGIPLRADQMSNSPFMKYMGSGLENVPLSGYAAKSDNARSAFTKAVTQTFGENSSTITPELMDSAFSNIGKKFDDVAARTNIGGAAIPKLQEGLSGILDEARQVLPEDSLKPLFNQATGILQKASGGEISGETYQALTRKGAPLDRAIRSADPNISHYAGQIRDALDDALQASANPEDLALLREARFQYKNLKTVQPLADKALGGQISPALLLQRVRQSYGDSFTRGNAGALGDLAQIGQTFLKEPPNSGTATRLVVNRILGAAGEAGLAGAAGAGAMGAGLLPAAGAAALGLGSGRLIGGVMDNPLTRNAIIRAGINNGAAPSFGGNAFTQSLIPIGVVAKNRLLGRSSPPAANAPFDGTPP